MDAAEYCIGVYIPAFFKEEYANAGIDDPDKVDTGAVIVTGETAKKQNAAQIVERLSNDTGKFIAATAGPNFESLLAAMGSGATNRSKEKKNTVLSCDIGGGTSNMAISKNGDVSDLFEFTVTDAVTIELTDDAPTWLYDGEDYDKTFFSIGYNSAIVKDYIITNIKPSGNDITIQCVNYDESIYS